GGVRTPPAARRGPAARSGCFRGSGPGLPLFRSVVSLGKHVQVDDSGVFTVSDLPPMPDLMLRVDGTGFAVTDAGPFTVEQGKTTDVGDVLVSTGLTLGGSVQDATRRAVAGAKVALFQGPALADDAAQPARPDRGVTSDSEGRFRFANARGAAFTLRATAAGYANAEVTGAPTPGEPTHELTVPIVMQPV